MSLQGKPLFPSACCEQTQPVMVQNSADIMDMVQNSADMAEDMEEGTVTKALPTLLPTSSDQRLGWLENKSFNTEDAIAIANLHTSREANQSHREDTINQKRPHSQGTRAKEKDFHGDNDGNEPKRHKRSHKHKSHKYTSRYSSDDGSKKKSSNGKKKKKHNKYKHESRSSKSRDEHKRPLPSSTSQEDQNISSHVEDQERHTQRIVPLKATWLDELGHAATEIYYIDTKADKNNLCFDSLHHTNSAFYKRLGNSCLGLNRETQRIFWRNKEKHLKKSGRSDLDRYFGKGMLKSNAEVSDSEVVLPTLISQAKQSHEVKALQSFISLVPASNSNKFNSLEVDPLGVYDVSTRQYLSNQPPMSSSTDQHSGKYPLNQSTEKFIQSKQVAEYNRYLHENPHDICKWLEFVNFQDTSESIHASTIGDSEIERRKTKTLFIVEKKRAILEKALKRNPGNIELQLAQLELCRESLSEPQQVKEWERVLQSHPDNIALWREYILFNQSSFSIFSVSKAVAVYGKCFEALQYSSDRNKQDRVDSNLTSELMDLFVQQCQLWRQAGHTEKGVAAFQAMVELNCFCPDNLGENASVKGQIAFLETFCDSGEPQFGTEGAKGWKTWMTKKEKGGWEELPPQSLDTARDDEEDSKPVDSFKRLWQVWLQEEVHRDQHHLLPWRSDAAKGETEDDCEDPDRMVLFDDISGVLFTVQSQQEKYNIILRFLEFLGVVTKPTSSSTSSSVHRHFCMLLEHPRQLSLDFGIVSVPQPVDVDSGIGWHQCCTGVGSNCGLFDSATEANADKNMTKSKDLQELIKNVFSQSLAVFDEPARTSLLVLRLIYEFSCVPQQGMPKQQKKQCKAARRFAKKLLSEEQNRNNLLLWEVFATWEWSLGNKEDACRMLDMALAFSKQLQDTHQKRAIAKVVSTYAELLSSTYTSGHNIDNTISHDNSAASCSTKESLHVLTTYVESSTYVPYKKLSNPKIPSVKIIKARKIYQELLEAAMKSYKENSATHKWIESAGSYIVHLARCYAKFQYLTVGLQAANVVMEQTLDCLKPSPNSTTHSTHHNQQNLDYELVMTAYTKLVAQHMLHNPTPLSIMRNLLKMALSEFPDNPALLQLFISTEAKSHIAGRVRRYFDRATRNATTPVPSLCAINAEKQRQLMVNSKQDAAAGSTSLLETGISNRIRSLFNRAISHKTSRHCVLVWRLYMQFEVQQGNIKRAQSIFYQALQHCPWAKVLYVDAVRYFPDKLADFHDLLMEKELRIRAPLEEIELLMQG